MEDFKDGLKLQLKEIDGLINKSNKTLSRLEGLPDVKILTSKSNGCHQYYFLDKESGQRKYAKKEEITILKKLAQRDYETVINKKLCANRKYLEKFLNHYDVESINNFYSKMSKARQELVVPLIETDELYIEKWKSQTYTPMPFWDDTEFYSNNGVRVRSKSELIIANLLEQYDVPYKYEMPLSLDENGIVRPDFIALNVRLRSEYVWEHLGMMDNEEYANKNLAKVNSYIQNGFIPGKNMILSFESLRCPISSQNIKKIIESYLL